jgi:hypothetical protein
VNTPLPLPAFSIISALAGHASRRPSNAPAAAFWLLNPTTPRISLNQRDENIRQLVEYLYGLYPPGLVALWRAEAAGLPPSGALELFHSHLDDRYPEFI